MRTVALLLCSLVGTELAVAQQVNFRQDFVLLFGPPPGYSQPIYSRQAAGGSDYVFFEGEGISLKVSLANWSARVLTMRTEGVGLAEAINVQLTRVGPGESSVQGVKLRLSPELAVDGGSARTAAVWGEDVVLQPKWYVTSVAELETARPLPAGGYRLTMIDVGVSCEPDCPVTAGGSGEFRFEVRPVMELTERVDRLMMRAYRSLMRGDYAEVDEHLDQVLKLYPAASAAYQALGRKAQAMGRAEEAADAFERGAGLLERKEDVLRPEASAGAAFASMRSDAQAARAAAKSRR